MKFYKNIAVTIVLVGLIIPFIAPLSSLAFPETETSRYERTIQPNDTYNTTVSTSLFFDESGSAKLEILLSTTPSTRLNVTVEERGTTTMVVNETTPITINLERRTNGYHDYALKIQNPNNSTVNVLKKETNVLRPFTGFSYAIFTFIGLFAGILTITFGIFFYKMIKIKKMT